MGVSYTMCKPGVVLLLISYASVVAVHGLGGHRIYSWTDGPNDSWLTEFANTHHQPAAVYTYGYPSGASHTTVAQDLIRELDIVRSVRSSFKRPVIFFAHGLGGLIVKEV
jgi:alpha-beta hydrolase superfamily lysophospholipase